MNEIGEAVLASIPVWFVVYFMLTATIDPKEPK